MINHVSHRISDRHGQYLLRQQKQGQQKGRIYLSLKAKQHRFSSFFITPLSFLIIFFSLNSLSFFFNIFLKYRIRTLNNILHIRIQTDKVEEVKAIEPSDEEIEKVLESTDDVVIVDKKEEESKEEKHKHEDAKPTSFKHKLQGYFGYLWNGQVMD